MSRVPTPSSSSPDRAACGVGIVARRDGRATHETLRCALDALANLEHRGGCAADGISGDGAGIMTDIPFELLGVEPRPPGA